MRIVNPGNPSANAEVVLEISDLSVDFIYRGGASRVVDRVSFNIKQGEMFCLVGESGSGKSVTALSIARLLPMPPARYVSGKIMMRNQDLMTLTESQLRGIRGGVVSYIFQEPGAFLNPAFKVGNQIKDVLKLHRPASATNEEVIRLLKEVGIPDPESRMRSFPHQLSGGMQQRVMIAIALACGPHLLVADEPTTALDVTIQAQILELLHDIKQRLGMSVLLITHNLGIVSNLADRVAVMYAGQIVELAPARDLLKRPLHPYTRALLNCVPKIGDSKAHLVSIPGTPPAFGAISSGCRFHPRCASAQPDCAVNSPELIEVEPGRWVRCPYWQH